MPVLDWFISSLASEGVLGYVGLGPGQEFIPYFLALVGFAMTAILAILQRPIALLFRFFARARGARTEEVKEAPIATNEPEASGEAGHDEH